MLGKSRRVENDALIEIPPTGFPSGELESIFHHPPYIVETAALHIASCPGYHLTHGVQVSHIRSGRLGGKGSSSRIGKKIEDLGRRATLGCGQVHEFTGIPIDIFPVRGLFRKDTDVLEGGEP